MSMNAVGVTAEIPESATIGSAEKARSARSNAWTRMRSELDRTTKSERRVVIGLVVACTTVLGVLLLGVVLVSQNWVIRGF